MKTWRIFFWAMLHSPEFRYCWIKSPITFGYRWGKAYSGWGFSISMNVRPVGIYMPYAVIDAYNEAHGLKPTYDEIPF